MGYSTEIAEKLISYLEEKKYYYTFDQDRGIIQMGFNIKCSLGHARCVIDIKEKLYIVYFILDVTVPENQRKEVAEYLTRANYGVICGNFEMDMRDGEVRYKYTVDNDSCVPSDQLFEKSLAISEIMLLRYGDNLLKVMVGMLNAEEAIKLVEEGKR